MVDGAPAVRMVTVPMPNMENQMHVAVEKEEPGRMTSTCLNVCTLLANVLRLGTCLVSRNISFCSSILVGNALLIVIIFISGAGTCQTRAGKSH